MLRPRAVGLLLTFVTLLVYLPTTLDPFINFDDPVYVQENPFVNSGFSLLGIKWAFVTSHASNWHPLTWLSHMLDCELFHLNPAGPHLVNSLFHAVNAGLLFALLLRLTNPCREGKDLTRAPSNLWPSAFAAALFAWHPLHVESVAWISERKDVLSTFFSLLSLLSYARYARLRSPLLPAEEGASVLPEGHDYALALIWFALALLSKPMPVTLPAVMLLLDFWPLDRWRSTDHRLAVVKKLFLEKVPFFLLSGLVCFITVIVQKHAESTLSDIPPGLRLENGVLAYAGYLEKMLWPANLSVLYPFDRNISLVLLVESGLLLAAISALAWRLRRTQPYLLTGWLWYMISLLPVIGLIQVGSQAMADRYTYFPLIGIFLAAAFLVQDMARQFVPLAKCLAGAAVAVLVACIILTGCQLTYWRDSEALFRHAIEVKDSDVARISLGAALLAKNEKQRAMTQFLVAWRMDPESVLANFNVAGILGGEDKPGLAAVYYQRATLHNSWMPAAYQNLGRVLVTLKRYNEAMIAFSQAAQIEPESATPHFLMGRLLLEEGRDAEAVKELNKAMDLEPQNLENLVYTATVLASCNDSKIRNGTRARDLAREVVENTESQDAAALDVLAMSCAELGRFPDALIIEQQAITVAGTSSQPEEISLLQKHFASYQNHQPWRQSFKSN